MPRKTIQVKKITGSKKELREARYAMGSVAYYTEIMEHKMSYDPRNIERNKRIRKLTDRAKSAGHITPGEAFHLLGVTRETINKYMKAAAATGEVIYVSQRGLFRDEACLSVFIKNSRASRKQTPRYSPKTDIEKSIFQQCRESPAMRRVLAVYGVGDLRGLFG
ncbi:DUF977 family protein [Salmonella enterica subsp. enterica]|uniref:DUF977 family protein n=1 Tax=Salmonella enterica TaxID=28901 RepID=UPI001079A0C7|nr:DUF977 family protein [Salmonella enterica subsp. enterica serovar Aba]EAX8473326.1 DUF977 family protein [Salmonella enterica]EEK5733367.1 DUF977 family protein [Salmonella enterica]